MNTLTTVFVAAFSAAPILFLFKLVYVAVARHNDKDMPEKAANEFANLIIASTLAAVAWAIYINAMT